MKLVVGGDRSQPASPDPNLIATVVDAWSLFAKLKNGEARSIRHLAELRGVDRGDVSRMVPLAFLAPDIVEAILEGCQPVGPTAAALKRVRDLPAPWAEQRRVLGFSRVIPRRAARKRMAMQIGRRRRARFGRRTADFAVSRPFL